MLKNETERVFKLMDGDVCAFEEQEAIHLKAVDKSGDPVELTSSSAKKLAEFLLKLAAQIDDE